MSLSTYIGLSRTFDDDERHGGRSRARAVGHKETTGTAPCNDERPSVSCLSTAPAGPYLTPRSSEPMVTGVIAGLRVAVISDSSDDLRWLTRMLEARGAVVAGFRSADAARDRPRGFFPEAVLARVDAAALSSVADLATGLHDARGNALLTAVIATAWAAEDAVARGMLVLSRDGISADALERVLAPANARRRHLADNDLLAGLPLSVGGNIEASSVTVDLAAGTRLMCADERVKVAYFPSGSVVGLVTPTRSGATVASGFVGSESLVGSEAWLPAGTALTDAVVLVAGTARKVPIDALQSGHGDLPRAFASNALAAAHARAREAVQGVACSAVHAVEGRLCRVLLSLHDRLAGDEVPLTQELLASLLGVRRRRVTVVANALEHAGFVVQSRGYIRVASRRGLEDAACECYHVLAASLV